MVKGPREKRYGDGQQENEPYRRYGPGSHRVDAGDGPAVYGRLQRASNGPK